MITFIKNFLNKLFSSDEDSNIPDPDRLGLIQYFTPPEGEEYSGDR
jgi:hypothetical protein